MRINLRGSLLKNTLIIFSNICTTLQVAVRINLRGSQLDNSGAIVYI